MNLRNGVGIQQLKTIIDLPRGPGIALRIEQLERSENIAEDGSPL